MDSALCILVVDRLTQEWSQVLFWIKKIYTFEWMSLILAQAFIFAIALWKLGLRIKMHSDIRPNALHLCAGSIYKPMMKNPIVNPQNAMIRIKAIHLCAWGIAYHVTQAPITNRTVLRYANERFAFMFLIGSQTNDFESGSQSWESKTSNECLLLCMSLIGNALRCANERFTYLCWSESKQINSYEQMISSSILNCKNGNIRTNIFHSCTWWIRYAITLTPIMS